MDFFDIKWIEVFDTIARALISLTALFLVTKLLGKKQVSQLSLFDYVIGISIGNFAAEMTINMDSQYANGLTAIIVFGLIAYLVSYVTMKSMVLRRFFIGTPTILIQNGKLIEKNLKKVKFDINDLLEECRGSGYFDLTQIEYALLEANGKLSILPKGEYSPVTIKDMKLKATKQELVANIIIDSKIMPNNLKNMKKDISWLDKELKIKGYKTLDNILLATLDINDKLTIYERNNHDKVHNVLE
ncbi:MAG: DUF421 domain-containing protein [Firmicutes bacterium]|nr:DUF421 domain-containing protein [Bacillota bacterium]